jgi:DMSO/TMAO reductase YedYZ molybdopterin-dependent catalytic subunit
MRWASVVLAAGVLISLAFGVLHSAGRPYVGYLTAMDFHVGAALAVIPFVVWHVLARPVKLRPMDLSRRNFLKGAALLGASGIGAALLPGAVRAPTGSYRSLFPVPTQWMFDSVPQVDATSWHLEVGSRSWSYGQLAAFDDEVNATIDCTGGWYSEQLWQGVWLHRLLPAGTAATSLNVRSETGYSRRFAIEDASRLLLATRVAGAALGPGNGFPVRLVVPGKRGFAWVKWVKAIDLEPFPWWWQPPFPLQ